MTPAKSEHYNDNKNSNSNLFTQAKRNDDLNNINYEQSAKTSPIKHKQVHLKIVNFIYRDFKMRAKIK